MVEKQYAWEDGATLEEHSKRKHKIVREYFARYLTVRCQLPMQSKFRVAIVDGFAGTKTEVLALQLFSLKNCAARRKS
jgi:hypothetical protein